MAADPTSGLNGPLFDLRTSRRSVLRAAAVLGLGAVGIDLLAACRPSPPSATSESGTPAARTSGAPASKAVGINTYSLSGGGTGGTLRIGMSAANVPIPDTPPTEGGEGARFVGTQIYEGLTRLDTNQAEKFCTPVPGMAESWSLSSDQLTWSFKLRRGLSFHDGTPFNAQAVKFGLDRIYDKSSEYYSPVLAVANLQYMAAISSYTVVDDFTFNITTSRPYAFLAWDLLRVFFPSPTAVRTYGNAGYVQHASGTGPFRMTRYVDGQVMELEPFDGYWQGKPKLDKLVLLPMPEPAARLAGLQAGDVDWAEVPPPDAVPQLKANNFQVMTGPYPHVITYQLNTYKPPFNDVRVRQAVNYAANRDATLAVINGFGLPASQYCHRGHPYFDEEWAGYSFDLDKARSLLAEAGYAGGLKVRMAYPPGGSGNMWPGPLNERLKADLRAVGIDVELVPIEWNNIISAHRAGFVNPDWAGYDAEVALQALNVTWISEAFAYHKQDLQTRWGLYGKFTNTRIAAGALYSGPDVVQAQRVRSYFRKQVAQVMADVDVLVTPTSLTPAERVDDVNVQRRMLVRGFTGMWNLIGLPALAVPCGFSSSRLPLSMQIVAKPFDESTALRVGDAYQRRLADPGAADGCGGGRVTEVAMTIAELAAALRRKELSSVELTRATFERADQLDPKLGVYLHRMDESALRQAAQADADFAAGIDRGPLQGIPLGIKDIISTDDAPTTAQSLILNAFQQLTDWHVRVAPLVAAAAARVPAAATAD